MALLFTGRPLKTLLLDRVPKAAACAWPCCWPCLLHPVGHAACALGFAACIRCRKSDATGRSFGEVLESAPYPWLPYVLMAVLPAFCEELAFRGFVLSGLRHLGQQVVGDRLVGRVLRHGALGDPAIARGGGCRHRDRLRRRADGQPDAVHVVSRDVQQYHDLSMQWPEAIEHWPILATWSAKTATAASAVVRHAPCADLRSPLEVVSSPAIPGHKRRTPHRCPPGRAICQWREARRAAPNNLIDPGVDYAFGLSIMSMRRWWRPPSNGVASQTSTISTPVRRSCARRSRCSWRRCGAAEPGRLYVPARPQRTPGTRLATIASPLPEPPSTIRARFAAADGFAVGRMNPGSRRCVASGAEVRTLCPSFGGGLDQLFVTKPAWSDPMAIFMMPPNSRSKRPHPHLIRFRGQRNARSVSFPVASSLTSPSSVAAQTSPVVGLTFTPRALIASGSVASAIRRNLAQTEPKLASHKIFSLGERAVAKAFCSCSFTSCRTWPSAARPHTRLVALGPSSYVRSTTHKLPSVRSTDTEE